MSLLKNIWNFTFLLKCAFTEFLLYHPFGVISSFTSMCTHSVTAVFILQEVLYRWWWAWRSVDCRGMALTFRQKIPGIFGLFSVSVCIICIWISYFVCHCVCCLVMQFCSFTCIFPVIKNVWIYNCVYRTLHRTYSKTDWRRFYSMCNCNWWYTTLVLLCDRVRVQMYLLIVVELVVVVAAAAARSTRTIQVMWLASLRSKA